MDPRKKILKVLAISIVYGIAAGLSNRIWRIWSMSFKVILFMWQFGLIDTFSAVSFIYNAGAQYSSIVVAALVDGNATKLPTIIFL